MNKVKRSNEIMENLKWFIIGLGCGLVFIAYCHFLELIFN